LSPSTKGEPPSFEDELAQDVIEIITVFSARLYGSRGQETKGAPQRTERE
jgi:putative resolvase